MSMETLYRDLFKDLTDVQWRFLHLLAAYPPKKYHVKPICDYTNQKIVDFDVIPIRCGDGIHSPSQKIGPGGGRHPNGGLWCYFCREDI